MLEGGKSISLRDLSLEERFEFYREVISSYSLLSDIFMRNVFKSKDCVEYVLRIIMNEHDLKVTESVVQQDYKLPDSYVIFITSGDVLKDKLPIYHINRRIIETGKAFGDRSNIIYVNSEYQDDSELGRLMHDFHCTRADEMYNEILAERVRLLKETSEGVDSMCAEMEAILDMDQKKTAQNMHKKGYPDEDIADVLEKNIATIKEWLYGATAAT